MEKTYEDENGYLRFKDSDKFVHRWVAEKKYGKDEVKGKEVHHLDGNKKNNEESNLILLTKKDHFLLQEYVKKNAPKGRRVMEDWAYWLILIGVLVQLPLVWIPYMTQFITVILVLACVLAGVKKIQ